MSRIPLLDKVANEEGTYTIKFTFMDEDGESTEPSTLYWWLTDLDGCVINSRSEVSATPVNPFYLTLQGDDLQKGVSDGDDWYRVATIKGTYNSDRGTNLPYTYSVMFKVRNLLVIAQPLYVSTADHCFTGEYLVCSIPA